MFNCASTHSFFYLILVVTIKRDITKYISNSVSCERTHLIGNARFLLTSLAICGRIAVFSFRSIISTDYCFPLHATIKITVCLFCLVLS